MKIKILMLVKSLFSLFDRAVLLKVISASALFAISSTASAVGVVLVSHQWTSDGIKIFDIITDGSHVEGFAASTATWGWDGTTLTSTGLYSATLAFNNDPTWFSIHNDSIMDLMIDTSGPGPGNANGTAAYSCTNGSWPAALLSDVCGGYQDSGNGIVESTKTYGPGIAYSRTIHETDAIIGDQRSIAAYDFGLVSIVGVNGMTAGDLIKIGNGIPVNDPNHEAMTFQVIPVPAAVWLFGSALGSLGWMRRRNCH